MLSYTISEDREVNAMYSQIAFNTHRRYLRRPRTEQVHLTDEMTPESSSDDTTHLLFETLTVIILYIMLALGIVGASMLLEQFFHLP